MRYVDKEKVDESVEIDESKIEEAKDPSYRVVFVTGNYDTVRDINAKTDLRKMYKDLDAEFMAKAGTDDYWIDDIIPNDRGIPAVDKEIFLDRRGRLDQNMIDSILGDDEFALKAQFLKDVGFDITEDNLEEVNVWGKATDLIDTSFGGRVPEDWAWEQLENFNPNLFKELEKDGASYFDIGRWVGDFIPNGDANWDTVDGNFVYTYMT